MLSKLYEVNPLESKALVDTELFLPKKNSKMGRIIIITRIESIIDAIKRIQKPHSELPVDRRLGSCPQVR